MNQEQSIENIKSFLLNRYKENLIAILIYGSVNTNSFIEGKSDIDTIIILKEQNFLNLEKERTFLFNKLKKYDFSCSYFHTFDSIKNYIKNRISFSTYLTIVSKDGSTILYQTPEFENLKNYLKNNPPTKQEIKNYIIEKDKYEIGGYFKGEIGFGITKSYFSHLRRKLQILNYFQNKNLIFDFDICLNNINLDNQIKNKLLTLHEYYKYRIPISDEQVKEFYNIAKKLTKEIMGS